MKSHFIICEIYENAFEHYHFTRHKQDNSHSVDSTSVHVMYEEESDSNKRFHQKSVVLFVSIFIVDHIVDQTKRIIKKKSQKRVEKKLNSQSLIELFDDAIDAYEKSISVRKILKNHKIDMSLLN